MKERLQLAEDIASVPGVPFEGDVPPVVNGQFGAYQHQP